MLTVSCIACIAHNQASCKETHEGEHDSLFLASISSEHNKNFILVKETTHPVFFSP